MVCDEGRLSKSLDRVKPAVGMLATEYVFKMSLYFSLVHEPIVYKRYFRNESMPFGLVPLLHPSHHLSYDLIEDCTKEISAQQRCEHECTDRRESWGWPARCW